MRSTTTTAHPGAHVLRRLVLCCCCGCRLNPTNFSTRLGKGAYHAFLDWWQVSTWYPYNTNLVDVYEKKHGKTFR